MRRTRQWVLVFWLVALVLNPTETSAELIVIYDSGNTRPVGPFLEVLAPSREDIDGENAQSVPTLGAADLSALLPLSSPGLSPGRVEVRKTNRRFARPFFLIGADPLSLEWLARHRERLIQIGAAGMLVEAKSIDELRAVAEMSKGLSIIPASASDIGRALGLSHYPVLVSRHGIEQ